METETINNEGTNKTSRLVILSLSVLITCASCAPKCKTEIAVYKGLYFKTGQSIELVIDDRTLLKEEFTADWQSNDLKEIDAYCCTKDSCKVKFVLENDDTVFYVSPHKTKRLMVGSDVYGKFSVATDEDTRSWIKM